MRPWWGMESASQTMDIYAPLVEWDTARNEDTGALHTFKYVPIVVYVAPPLFL